MRTIRLRDGVQRSARLNTSLVWNTYDENTETLSGSNSSQGTAGIYYQNETPILRTALDTGVDILRRVYQNINQRGHPKPTNKTRAI